MATKTVYLKVDYDYVQNPNAQTVTTYEFNLQGRMSKVTLQTYNGGTLLVSEEITEYKYDHKGNRVEARHTEDTNADSSLETDETTTYLNDPDNFTGYSQTIEETTVDNLDSANEIEKLIYTIGLDVIEQVKYNANNPSGLSSTFLYDAHGSTRILTDYLGAIAIANSVKQIFKYDAYGNAIAFNPTQALTRILYSGEMLDTRINWQYLRARFYNSATGNFNRLDPFFGNMKDPQSFHKYLYTHADPVNGIDPTGRSLLTPLTTLSVKAYLTTALVSYAIGKAIEAAVLLIIDHNLRNFEWFTKWDLLSLIPGGVAGKALAKAWRYPATLITKSKNINRLNKVVGKAFESGAHNRVKDAFASLYPGGKVLSLPGINGLTSVLLKAGTKKSGLAHIIRRHLVNFFEGAPNARVLADTKFFPAGTSVDDLLVMLDDALVRIGPQRLGQMVASPQIVTQEIRLANGILTKVAIKDGAIHTFFPVEGPGVLLAENVVKLIK